MGETLLQFQSPVRDAYGVRYEARACGGPMPEGGWEGWLEFTPIGGGESIRSQRETTQPNRADTEYWATGLTPVYLEGALARAMKEPPILAVRPHHSVLNPFSVYQKGEALLHNQLGALSAWHLVQIVLDYELSALDVERLNRMPQAELIELIVGAVRHRATAQATVSYR
jgi:hypothetical protein